MYCYSRLKFQFILEFCHEKGKCFLPSSISVPKKRFFVFTLEFYFNSLFPSVKLSAHTRFGNSFYVTDQNNKKSVILKSINIGTKYNSWPDSQWRNPDTTENDIVDSATTGHRLSWR